MTVLLWVQFSDIVGEQTLIQKLFGRGEAAQSGWHISKSAETSFKWSVSYVAGRQDLEVNVESLVEDEWHQIVGMFDGDLLTLFWDGKVIGEIPSDDKGLWPARQDPVKIGVRNEAAAEWQDEDLAYFAGVIDEVLIVAAALSDDEIKEHFDTAVIDSLSVHPEGMATVFWSRLKSEAARETP